MAMTLDPQRWRSLSSLFNRMLDCDPADRDVLLRQICAADPALAAALLRMLGTIGTEGPLDRPPVSLSARMRAPAPR